MVTAQRTVLQECHTLPAMKSYPHMQVSETGPSDYHSRIQPPIVIAAGLLSCVKLSV